MTIVQARRLADEAAPETTGAERRLSIIERRCADAVAAAHAAASDVKRDLVDAVRRPSEDRGPRRGPDVAHEIAEAVSGLEERVGTRHADLDARFAKRLADLESRFNERQGDLEARLCKRHGDLEAGVRRDHDTLRRDVEVIGKKAVEAAGKKAVEAAEKKAVEVAEKKAVEVAGKKPIRPIRPAVSTVLRKDVEDKLRRDIADVAETNRLDLERLVESRLQQYEPLARAGRWLWRTGHLARGGWIAWDTQTANTGGFAWTKETPTRLVTSVAGLYKLAVGAFTSADVTLQVCVGGEPVLTLEPNTATRTCAVTPLALTIRAGPTPKLLRQSLTGFDALRTRYSLHACFVSRSFGAGTPPARSHAWLSTSTWRCQCVAFFVERKAVYQAPAEVAVRFDLGAWKMPRRHMVLQVSRPVETHRVRHSCP